MKLKQPIYLFCYFIYLLFLIIATLHLNAPDTNLNLQGVPVWLEICSLLILYGYINLSVWGLGQKIVRLLPKSILTTTEANLLSFLLGFAVLALGIFALGMLGFMNFYAVFIYLALSGLLAFPEWPQLIQSFLNSIKSIHRPTPHSLYEILYWGFGAGTFILLIFITLTPVWDYDALMYHLEIPRQYILHGRIYFDPSLSRSSYPLLAEMLFIPGIMLHLEALAKLISLTYFIIFLWSTFALGNRLFNREVALLATGILIGTPSFPTWAGWASIDFAWPIYELWSLYALVIWLSHKTEQDDRWLILAGLMSGLAASTKFLALPSILLNCLVILWNTPLNSKLSFFKAIKQLCIFGMSAFLVMAPWYVRNLVWTGNPFYPVIFGGARFEYLSYYMQSFGVGKSWSDFLLLPLNVYRYQSYFSTISWEIIHPALWLAFGLIFLSDWKKYNYLAIYSLLYFIIWAFNGQLIRLLTPVTSIVALLAAYVLAALPKSMKNVLASVLLGSFLCLSFTYQLWEIRDSGIMNYFIGRASAANLLKLNLEDYKVINYIETNLSETDRVQFLWDGRSYYCDQRCIADETQALAMLLSHGSPAPKTLAHQLWSKGITHILLSRPDAVWFIGYHDPDGLHRSAFDYFEQTFLPACAKSIFVDGRMTLYALTCE